MKVVYEKLPSKKIKCVAAIGVFDGIHRGHRFIIDKVKQEAKKLKVSRLLITFDQPPQVILGKNFPGYITDMADKKLLAASLGIDCVWFLKATPSFFKLSGEKFIATILKYFNLKKLVAGSDFRFGRGAYNSVKCLKKFSRAHGFDFIAVKKKKIDGITVSSSRIRKLIAHGRLKEVKKLLGRNYFLKGKTVRGAGLGRKLGFPTANLHLSGYILPKEGVYAGFAYAEGKKYLCAINIGGKPGATILEAHLIGFSGNLYGKFVGIEFLSRIRGEKKFSSSQALARAISKDVELLKKAPRS